ncbi:MAG: hypothetical protein ACI9H8_001021 [Lysobacterales bacterium]|jgi:hypothetical protein
MNRKNLTAAVLAGLAGAAGIVGTASASHDNDVFLNPDGLGQVLIYPYYTVNAGNATLMSVVNTTGSAKAVKVRFKEGENSREVLDFNLYLSEYDVWSGAVINDGGTPTLIIGDNSCTVPYLYANDSDDDGFGEQVFLDFDYTGENADGGSGGIERAMEGHMEIIEMGAMWDDPFYIDSKTRPYGSETAATHVEDENGDQVPLDCQMLNDQWSTLAGVDGLWLDDNSADMDELSGGLFGSASVVNVGQGTLFSYNARAIGDFDNEGDLHVEPGTSEPNLNSGDNWSAHVNDGNGDTDTFSYGRGVDAVSAIFMHDAIMNEYSLGGIAAAQSEWVITFPTKGWYVDSAWYEVENTFFINTNNPSDPGCAYADDHDGDPQTPNLVGQWEVNPTGDPSLGSVNGISGVTVPPACDVKTGVKVTENFPSDPFTSEFDGEACEEVSFYIWDANENAASTPTPGDDLPIVSPPPPPGTSTPGVAFELCYETSILQFGDSDIFGSSNTHTVNTTNESGWAKIGFDLSDEDGDINVLSANDGGDLTGLPVTGFWAAKFTNGNVGGVLSNYGGLFDHKGSVSVD